MLRIFTSRDGDRQDGKWQITRLSGCKASSPVRDSAATHSSFLVTQQCARCKLQVTPGSVIPGMRGDQTSERAVK